MTDQETVQLAHGGGGRLSRALITREIVARFGDGPLAGLPDAARLPSRDGHTVFTTDSFVVQPLEFPGGNIGDLAVHGTVNDLAVCGGKPRWLSLSLIIEEGLSLPTLRRVLDAVLAASRDCGVTIATGDLKVVPRGQCDGLYVNTAGLGECIPDFELGVDRVAAGDHVLVSGTLADHGVAVMAARESLQIENGPLSDTGPVHRLVQSIADLGPQVRFMRDPTRGGTAAVLNEVVEGRPIEILLDASSLPLAPATRAVCELLGFDPLHVASEGRVILICAPDASDEILHRWQAQPEGRNSTRLGTVRPLPDAACAGDTSARDAPRGRVVLQTVSGGRRLVDVPRGELLPRIC